MYIHSYVSEHLCCFQIRTIMSSAVTIFTHAYAFLFSSVQSLSSVWLFVTPWITALQATLSITNSRSSPRLTSIKLVMSSSHLILGHPLLLLPPIPPRISLFQWVNSSHEVAKLLCPMVCVQTGFMYTAKQFSQVPVPIFSLARSMRVPVFLSLYLVLTVFSFLM